MNFSCPQCEAELKKIKSKKNDKHYWICIDEKCGYITSDRSGRPAPQIKKTEAPPEIVCPDCESSMNLVSGAKFGDFFSCINYPECKGSIAKEAPKCLGCGNYMKLRTKKEDGSKFWGCRKYPECKITVPI